MAVTMEGGNRGLAPVVTASGTCVIQVHATRMNLYERCTMGSERKAWRARSTDGTLKLAGSSRRHGQCTLTTYSPTINITPYVKWSIDVDIFRLRLCTVTAELAHPLAVFGPLRTWLVGRTHGPASPAVVPRERNRCGADSSEHGKDSLYWGRWGATYRVGYRETNEGQVRDTGWYNNCVISLTFVVQFLSLRSACFGLGVVLSLIPTWISLLWQAKGKTLVCVCMA